MAGLDRIARSLPLPLKGLGRRAVRVIDPLLVRRYRRRTGDTRPIPPVPLRLSIGAGTSVDHYVESGERTARELMEVLGRTDRTLDDAERVLDFGCGCGRIAQSLRLLGYDDDRLELHGCDINDHAVEWANANLAGTFRVNGFRPPLPYPDAFFDVVLAVSVFTHLDEAGQDAWLEEIRRVLKPNGVGCLSVGGSALLEVLTEPGKYMNSRDFTRRMQRHKGLPDDGLIFEPYVRSWANSDGMRGTGEGYGMTLHGPRYVREHWSRWFEVDEIVPASVNGVQDAVLVRPNGRAE